MQRKAVPGGDEETSSLCPRVVPVSMLRHRTLTLLEMRTHGWKPRMDSTMYPAYVPAPQEFMNSSVILLL